MRKYLAPAVILLSAAALLAAPVPKADQAAKPDYSAFKKKLTPDDQVLNAVDRLTFGPRPGDVKSVRKMGLKKWIDLQLHPERIPENPELATRLEPLESLRLTPDQAAHRYPTPQLIRAVAQGRQLMPADPLERAAIERLVRRIKTVRGEPDNDPLQPRTPLDQLLSPGQIRTLRSGSLDQKKELLASLAAGNAASNIDDVLIALPPPLRNQLLPAATPDVRRKMVMLNAPQQLIAYDLSEGKLYRAILSNRQLEEELVDFWYNHFNVFLDKGADRFLVPSYERDAIRPHVLGHFRELLESTATNPAMLFYLDNWESVAPDTQRRPAAANRPVRGLNENYARELMELHTLGVDGGYTQKDVTEVARCFTGWTIRAPQAGGGFFYNDKVHDKGQKVVLGVVIPAGGGREDGEKVLDILAKHPATAKFVSRELAQRFVADNPPPELIDRMAKTFQKTHGDMREVMKTMLRSPQFSSQGAYRAKIKSPFEMIASAIRATGAELDYAFPLAQQIAQLGEPLYRKLEPTGYSSVNAQWINSAALLARMNFALALTSNRVPGVKIDPDHFTADPAQMARQMLFTDASPQTRAAIEKALEKQQAASQAADAASPAKRGGRDQKPKAVPPPPSAAAGSTSALVAGLLLGSPDFQRR